MTAHASGVCLALAALSASVFALAGPVADDSGQRLYRRGLTVEGSPVEASRATDSLVRGAAAACINCHQRSGLGSHEGRLLIPPVTGRYLFRPRAQDGDDRNIPFVEGMRGERSPYTDATLARAIRDGVDADGRTLDYLMPRYSLSGDDMASLIDYLKRLDKRRIAGVSDTTLHFATIITPDADPAKRRGMLDVMTQFFADRNNRQMVAAPRMGTSGRTAYSKEMFMVHRRWELHVWELTGPPSTWQQQLEAKQASQPVLAVLSGLGGANWAPVHAFCETSAVPCLFPNVEVPVDDEQAFYSLYFSKGVLLEAALIAKRMSEAGSTPSAVVQVFRIGDSGEAGAHALAAALERRGIAATNYVIGGGADEVAQAVRSVAAVDAAVFWLRPADIASLGAPPPQQVAVYLSGLMGGLEGAPLPLDWRTRTNVVYPFDLPERRRVRVDFALGWLAIKHIPVVAQQVQADTFLACGLLAETLSHMVDTFVPDYLVERTQDALEHRVLTGYYPRLSLATGQRFASKGGYLVRFTEPHGQRLVAEQGWQVP
jgi:hypothetical protein